MVRDYKRKKPKVVYDEEKVAEAIEKIRRKEWTYEKASNESGIPVGTLASRISRNSNGPVGRPTALNTNEEKHLVDLILTLQSYGELSAIEDVLKYASDEGSSPGV
ncbi:unnamed protein product [Adineta ricciae]|uniref:HTH psq-type domain-containing protein n=1 Tax=Adineta ricciae TaxID=249248 RepID=A0A815W559_ADIRI|nr:unnamed protein product [Adineta ricciae]CAF1539077.1 unnamed protein product [Adineta ricciae]